MQVAIGSLFVDIRYVTGEVNTLVDDTCIRDLV